jgi:hypothetical protein
MKPSRHSGAGRNPVKKLIPRVRGCCRFIGFTTTAYPSRVSGQNRYVDRLHGSFSINWIPACAGMTALLEFHA